MTPCGSRHRQAWPATRRRPERGPGRGNAAPGDAAASADTAPMPKVAPRERDTGKRGRRTPRRRTRRGRRRRGTQAPASADTARTARVTRCEHATGETGRASAARAGNADGTGNPAPPRWLRGRRRRGGRRSSMGTAAGGAATKRARLGRGALLLRVPNAGRRFANSPPVGAFPRGVEEVGGTRWGTRRGWGRSLDADAPLAPTRANSARVGAFPFGACAVRRASVGASSVGKFFHQGSARSERLPLRRPPSGGLPCRGALRQVFSVRCSPSGVLRRGPSIGGGREPGVPRSGGSRAKRLSIGNENVPLLSTEKGPTAERGGPRGRRSDRVGWWSARHGRGWRRWRRHGSRCEPGLRWMAPGSDGAGLGGVSRGKRRRPPPGAARRDPPSDEPRGIRPHTVDRIAARSPREAGDRLPRGRSTRPAVARASRGSGALPRSSPVAVRFPRGKRRRPPCGGAGRDRARDERRGGRENFLVVRVGRSFPEVAGPARGTASRYSERAPGREAPGLRVERAVRPPSGASEQIPPQLLRHSMNLSAFSTLKFG